MSTKMSTKKMVQDWINDLVNFGETYIGSIEIVGVERVIKNHKALAKEVEKRFPGMVLCWNNETGIVWMA